MPKWGPSKAVDAQTKVDEAQAKRRKEEEPDGPVSTALKYLKMGFLPVTERVKAENDYENEQERKRRKQQENK